MTLALAMILDAVLGEPKWLWSRVPHPAVVMGRMISWGTAELNQGAQRKEKGVVLVIALCVLAAGLGLILAQLGWFIEALCAAILLAQRSLVDHVAAVARGLRMSVAQGRRDVAMIVGRDTADMSEPAVTRAAVESAAENFADGVIAPAFWFALAGLPGILVYKMVNTADSMIGYRTPEFESFGWAAARLDDVLNWIPARLSAVLIAAPFGALNAWANITSEAKLHRSPNAGWPEAAMARVLNLSLSGPRSYDGAVQDYPWVHPDGNRDGGPKYIDRSTQVLWAAWAFALVIVIGGSIILSLIG